MLRRGNRVFLHNVVFIVFLLLSVEFYFADSNLPFDKCVFFILFAPYLRDFPIHTLKLQITIYQ